MDNFDILIQKLENFIRKFYLNQLLRGVIFFVAIGLLYFLITLFIESILWLDPFGRSVLFWSFVAVEVFLFGRFIVYPLLKLFKISRGIDHRMASEIIGKHFPAVSDKLLNVLQLKEIGRKSELLMASVDQKALELRPVPFSTAVNFKKNIPYLKYAAVPIIIVLFILFSGKGDVFASSYERVVNYKMAYEPPAPFAFEIANEDLIVQEDENFTLRVLTKGEVIPEAASIHFNGQTYFLNPISPGSFEYNFGKIDEEVEFRLTANDVKSSSYEIKVLEVPKIRNFRMLLNFPAHTGLKDEVVEGTGNAVIPEGTTVSWEVAALATEAVKMQFLDTVVPLQKEGEVFSTQSRIRNDFQYQLSTSNSNIQEFEKLQYELEVVKDEFPRIILEHKMDSLDTEAHYFYGRALDDYAIRNISLVAYPSDRPEEKIIRNISSPGSAVAEFLSTFPDTLELQEGTEYRFYYEVTDNDAVNGYKSVKSEEYTFRKKTQKEKEDERLENQEEAIKGIDGSLEEMEDSKEELKEFLNLPKQKREMDFNDRKKLEQFLKRQKRQNEMMESFTEKLKQTLEESPASSDENFREELEERLARREEELQENEKLLEELREYSDKIKEEGLQEKLEELSRNRNNQERNLEQLLELTKRYYVQEKIQKISSELQELGEEQEQLAEQEENTQEAQDSLSKETKAVMEDLKELEEENSALEEPMDTGAEEEKQEEILEEQKEAEQNLQEGKKEDAKKNQKKAGERLKEMGAQMQQQMQMSGMQQMQEDVEMLRQILDNLVTFSFRQEDLMERFNKIQNNTGSFAGNLREQAVLRENFEHVDDSLYALALRNPMISEEITGKLIDVQYDLDKSLERLAQNEIAQGIASQQYVITGANDLAFFLSQTMNNMQQMLNQSMSPGQGEGQQKQLQDIIQDQQQLGDQMQEGLQEQNRGEGKKGRSESENGELFEIFQQQQMLREALHEQLQKNGSREGSKALEEEMRQIEEKILEDGFDEGTLERMRNLEHKLLELEEAGIEQGQKPERESESNRQEFRNEVQDQKDRLKEYFKAVEILQRQSLPLRQIYKQKVQEYFERESD